VDGDDLEVVPGRPLEADDDEAEVERLGDDARERAQQLAGRGAGAYESGDLEEAVEVGGLRGYGGYLVFASGSSSSKVRKS
jgi:hypothetical protein